MRLDRRFFVVLSVSLVWALVVSAMFYRLASGAAGRHSREQRKPMVVACKALPVGGMVTRDSVQLRDVPESFFPAGACSRLEDVVDRPVISPIQPDEPVVAARLADKGSGMGLAPLIPSGMRALSVRVNDVVGVSGFILPGMRVDVLVTGHPEGRNETVTRTVLQNIGVLSAGQTTQADGKSQSIQAAVVTLMVNPQEAEALTLAYNEGKIQLVLRNSADDKTTPTNGSRLRDLYGTSIADEAPVRPLTHPAPATAAPPAEPKAVAQPMVQPLTPVVVSATPARDEIEVIHGKEKFIAVFPKGTELR